MSKATCRTPHNEIRCLRRHRGCLEYRTVVAFEDIEPGTEIVRMAHGRCYPEFSAQKRSTKLCNQFLARIGFAAMPAREIAVEA